MFVHLYQFRYQEFRRTSVNRNCMTLKFSMFGLCRLRQYTLVKVNLPLFQLYRNRMVFNRALLGLGLESGRTIFSTVKFRLHLFLATYFLILTVVLWGSASSLNHFVINETAVTLDTIAKGFSVTTQILVFLWSRSLQRSFYDAETVTVEFLK